MADLESFMTAMTTIKCSVADCATFQLALDEERQRQEDDGWGSHEVRCDCDPDDGLLIYSECFGDDDLSDGVCQAVGGLLTAAGLEYMEFSFSQSCQGLAPGAHDGGRFRINCDGRLVWPELNWI